MHIWPPEIMRIGMDFDHFSVVPVDAPRIPIGLRTFSCLEGWQPWLDVSGHWNNLSEETRSDRSVNGTRSPTDTRSSRSSLECSPPCHGGDQGFKSPRGRSEWSRDEGPESRDALRQTACLQARWVLNSRHWTSTARYANRQSGQAQTLVIVGSTPSRANSATGGLCLRQQIQNEPERNTRMRRLGIGEPTGP